MTVVKVHTDSAALLPVKAHASDAGFDLRAASAALIQPGKIVVVSTGVRLALPAGFVAKVFVRSSLGFKYGIQLANGTGIIDADYRGEIKVALVNLGERGLAIDEGERFAQVLIERVEPIALVLGNVHEQTARGTGGFGSTGVA